MRFFVFLIAAALWLSVITAPPSLAQSSEGNNGGSAEGIVKGDDLEKLQNRKTETLNSLFDDLKRQSDTKAASRTSKRIWQLWNASGSDSIDLLMDRVSQAMKKKKNNVALDLLDQVIALKPDYAEGWNRRATLYFSMKEFSRSIADIEQVLALESRHFGALSGLAVILQGLGRDQKALQTWYKVLEIYPANEQAQSSVIKLEEKLSGSPT